MSPILDEWNNIINFTNLQDLIKLKRTCSKLNRFITKIASPMIILSKQILPRPGDHIIKNTIIIKERDIISNIVSNIRSSFVTCKFSIVYAENFTNDDLKYIPLTHLDLSYDIITYNAEVTSLTKAIIFCTLMQHGHMGITNIGPDYLNRISLTSLSLSGNTIIANKSITHLTNLKCIDLSYNRIITYKGIQPFISTLTTLNLSNNKNFTDDQLKLFVNLTSINLSHNNVVSINGIINLHLIQLDLCRNVIFSAMDVNLLTYLKRLDLCKNTKINPKHITISCLIKTLSNFHVW